ncbi:proton-conducting transporter membrane subunit [Natranaerofaba carboxydovora]|uniref:proton-conducting transporter transmembrane domain-containing protein n=1 Tax=Natranaerofaba carboxydovora TaxID=2742683 RepID=UPI001F138FC1|nr:proton-conducting transporter membrane subunit [Natranaerofaba carboxydovora]UMZ75445.1 Na(+)/H(+) antiporter subunit A [Natranaerofaba carboxydovora]
MYLFVILGILLPVLVSPLMLILSDKKRKRLMLTIIGSYVFLAIYNFLGGFLGEAVLLSEIGFFEGFHFQEHAYSRIALIGFTFVGAFALLFGLQTQTKREMTISLWALVGAVGVSLAGDFLTMFLFWEILTFSVAGLILIGAVDRGKITSGIKFLYLHVTGGLFLLLGILLHYSEAGSFAIDQPEAGAIFFLLGFGFKAAFLPLHVWVNWGYPTASLSTSVLLSGLTTKIGVYAIARVLPSHEGIVLMGALMAVVGITCALFQNNLRSILSYSIVSKIGYMLAAIGLGSSLSVDAGMLHLINHMLYKALLFMSVGALLYSTGSEDIRELNHGEDKSNFDNELSPAFKIVPIAFVGAVIGSLSISGVPLFNGYISNYLIKYATEGTGIVEPMLLIASVVTVLTFAKFVYYGFLKAKGYQKREVPISMQLSIVATSITILALGIFPEIISGLVPYSSSLSVYSLSGVSDVLLLIGVGILIFVITKGILATRILLPNWLSIEYIFSAFVRKAGYSLHYLLVNLLDRKNNKSFLKILLDTETILGETTLVNLIQTSNDSQAAKAEGERGLSFDSKDEKIKRTFRKPIKELRRPIQERFENINFDQTLIFACLALIMALLMFLG